MSSASTRQRRAHARPARFASHPRARRCRGRRPGRRGLPAPTARPPRGGRRDRASSSAAGAVLASQADHLGRIRLLDRAGSASGAASSWMKNCPARCASACDGSRSRWPASSVSTIDCQSRDRRPHASRSASTFRRRPRRRARGARCASRRHPAPTTPSPTSVKSAPARLPRLTLRRRGGGDRARAARPARSGSAIRSRARSGSTSPTIDEHGAVGPIVLPVEAASGRPRSIRARSSGQPRIGLR